jgi:hypothetical protein
MVYSQVENLDRPSKEAARPNAFKRISWLRSNASSRFPVKASQVLAGGIFSCKCTIPRIAAPV